MNDTKLNPAPPAARTAGSQQRMVGCLRGQYLADCDTTLTTKGNRLAFLYAAICPWVKEIRVHMSDTAITIEDQTSNADISDRSALSHEHD